MATTNNQNASSKNQGLYNMKSEIANELGVNINGYAGNNTARQNGSVGGEMVKRMISQYEQGIK